MEAFIRAWSEGPPLENGTGSRLTSRGYVNEPSSQPLGIAHTTLISWGCYAAQRRLRLNFGESCWLKEVLL